MELIHEHVTVSTSQCAPPQRAAGAALQFVAANAGFAAVRFRADFRDSCSVQLVLLSDLKHATWTLECELPPLERRVIAYVLKIPHERAFVRVHYAVRDVASPALDELERAQQAEAAALEQTLRDARASLGHIRQDWLEPTSLSGAIAARFCDDINRFFGDRMFVDLTFAPCLSSLLGGAGEKRGSVSADRADSSALYNLCTWRHLPDVVDTSWVFATDEKKASEPLPQFRSPIPGHDSFLCALACLFGSPHRKRKLMAQLFGFSSLCEHELRRQRAMRVHVCAYGTQWKHVVVDLFAPGFPIGNGLMTVSSASTPGEVFPMLLQKAYAKLKGSYAAVSRVPMLEILRELSVYPSAEFDRDNAHAEDAASTSALQTLLCRRLPRRHGKDAQHDQSARLASRVFVASFGAIDNHHCAFPLISSDRHDGVQVHDVGELVRSVLKRPADATNRAALHDEKPLLAVTWSELFALAPRVWVQLSYHSEVKCQRVKFARKRGAASRQQVQFAFSVAELSQVAIVIQHQGGSHASSALEATLWSVGHNFSPSALLTASASDAAVWGAGIVESQITASLGPGEYLLTVEVTTTKTREKPDEEDRGKLHQPPAHTQQSTEENLALLFECLDQNMDGVISSTEIAVFLELHEHMDPPAEALIDRFVDRFGTSLDNVSRGLLRDDLRDVYSLFVAEKGRSSASSNPQQRYAELLWHDLLRVLRFGSTEGAIEELRCCVQCADESPVLNLVVLPDDDSASSP